MLNITAYTHFVYNINFFKGGLVMDASLAKNGLGEFTLPKATTDKLGVNTAKVKESISTLETKISSLKTLITNLDASGNDIIKDWEGDGKDTFKSEFPTFLTEFKEVPKSLKSLRDWTNDLLEGYGGIDSEIKEKLGDIFKK